MMPYLLTLFFCALLGVSLAMARISGEGDPYSWRQKRLWLFSLALGVASVFFLQNVREQAGHEAGYKKGYEAAVEEEDKNKRRAEEIIKDLNPQLVIKEEE